MIHDSYGVHACDVPLMNKVLRQQFVKLYERDVLNEFLTELRQHNPKVLLPAPPALGTLEIKHVEHSMYFFA